MNFTSLLAIFLALFTTSTFALPLWRVPSNMVITRDIIRDEPSLSARQLFALMRGAASKLGSKVTEKAGKKASKEGKGKKGVDVQAVAQTMATNLEKMGRPQIMGCLVNMVEHMAQFGGSNSGMCDKPSAAVAKKQEQLAQGKQKAYASSSKLGGFASKLSEAKRKAFGGH